MDEFEVKVLNTVKKHGLIPPGSSVCAAVSGGPDSMALLRFLMEARQVLDFTLSAVNVEHGIRGKESIRDSEFVKSFCKENGVPLQIFLVDALKHAADTKQGTEAAARELRYRCFDSLRKKNDRLALGHHRGDQAETVLLRLFRGSGAGLSGMDYMRDGYYIRPLLDVPKEDILGYAVRENIPYVKDSSNADDGYDRNFVRNRIMPLIGERFPGGEAAIIRAADILRADSLYIESMLPELYLSGGEAGIDFSHFALPDALINRLIFKAFSLLGVTADIEERHINLIKELQRAGESGAELAMPHKIKAVKDYTCITLMPAGNGNKVIFGGDFAEVLREGELSFGDKRLTLELISKKEYEEHKGAGGRTLFADAASIPENAVIRQRLAGDCFKKFGGGTLPLSDFFIDKKVPARRRGDFPLIAADSEVLCVCGLEIGEKLKVARKTAKVLKITIEEKI